MTVGATEGDGSGGNYSAMNCDAESATVVDFSDGTGLAPDPRAACEKTDRRLSPLVSLCGPFPNPSLRYVDRFASVRT
jgi:hypothetical protein